MKSSSLRYALPLIFSLVLGTGATPSVWADSPARSVSQFASSSGTLIYLGAAVGLPLLEDGGAGRTHALRTADAGLTSVLIGTGISALVREERPNGQNHDSFPSDHATATFAAATVESSLHPRQAPYWYLGAALISLSRLRLNEHHPQDVLAGAALGYGVARLELSSPRGLILSPIIPSRTSGYGLAMSMALP